MRKTIVIFFVFFSWNVFCQESKTVCISGLVVDSLTQKPLYYATVCFPEYDHCCFTDNKGYFIFCPDTIKNNYSLIIKYVGYQTINMPHLNINVENPITYKLKPNINTIDTTIHPIIKHRHN